MLLTMRRSGYTLMCMNATTASAHSLTYGCIGGLACASSSGGVSNAKANSRVPDHVSVARTRRNHQVNHQSALDIVKHLSMQTSLHHKALDTITLLHAADHSTVHSSLRRQVLHSAVKSICQCALRRDAMNREGRASFHPHPSPIPRHICSTNRAVTIHL